VASDLAIYCPAMSRCEGQETDVDARADVDAMLVTMIFGGTTEIQKEIIACSLGL
jgi:hypothetical protein